MLKNIFIEAYSPDNKYTLIVEDDGRVAYAYLLEGGDVVGDVWLYNRMKSPEEPEWNHAPSSPFLNAREYVKEDNLELPNNEKEISIKWNTDSGSEMPLVEVYINGCKHATVSPGQRPGYCRLALKDGPLAKKI